MKNLKDKFANTKDKVVGEFKEAVGKISDNDTMELEGKLQSAKSDLKMKFDKDKIEDKFEDIKEDVAGKINDFIDKKKKDDK